MDLFHLRTAQLQPGIYCHRLVDTTLQAPQNQAKAVLGRSQSAGIIDPASTVRAQAGVQAGYLAGTTVYVQAAYRDTVAAPACIVNLTNGEALTVRP